MKTYQLAREEAPLPVGRKFLTKAKNGGKDAAITLQFGDREIQGTMNTLEVRERLYEFPEEGGIRISILKDQKNMEMVLDGGKLPPKELVKATVGKVIFLGMKEGKWLGQLAGEGLQEDGNEEVNSEIEKLEKVYNSQKSKSEKMFGLKPRAVGERWDVDATLMPGIDGFDVTGGKFTLQLKEVKEFQGELCAVIETTFDVKALSNEEDKKGMTMNLRGSGRIVRSLDLLFDLKETGEAQFEMEGNVPPPAPPNAMMKTVGRMTMESRMTEVKEGE